MSEIDLGRMLVNMSSSFDAFRALIFAIAVIAGFWFFIKGCFVAIELSKTGQSQQASASKVFGNWFYGAAIFTLGSTISNVWATWTDTPSNLSIVAYELPSQVGAPAAYAHVIQAALGFVQLIGYAFAFYGVVGFKKLSDGNAQGDSPVIKAWTHFLGGLVAINIGPFLQGLADLAIR